VAWTEYEEKVYKVWNAKEANQESIDLASAPGTIVKANSKEGLIIKTLDGAISITEIQAPGSKKMNTLDFLRGNAIKEGTILK
jgi:methionyl-tRNA formyltransferase